MLTIPELADALADRIEEKLPRGRLVVIPGGPHCVNYSTPDAFALVVRTFLVSATP